MTLGFNNCDLSQIPCTKALYHKNEFTLLVSISLSFKYSVMVFLQTPSYPTSMCSLLMMIRNNFNSKRLNSRLKVR